MIQSTDEITKVALDDFQATILSQDLKAISLP